MNSYLIHYGIPGQEWGVRNGPPYPLSQEKSAKVRMKATHKPDESKQNYSSVSVKNVYSFDELKKFNDTDNLKDVIDNVCSDLSGFDLYNCQNCSVAFDLIKRGYKVKAKPMPDGSNVGDIEKFYEGGSLKSVGIDISKDMHDLLNDLYKQCDSLETQLSTLNAPSRSLQKKLEIKLYSVYDKIDQISNDLYVKSIVNCENEIASFGDNSRGTIVVGWNTSYCYRKRTDCYHAFNYECIDGNIIYYDVQSHRDWKKWGGSSLEDFVDGMDPRELYVMRTDNLEPTKEVFSAVY